MKGQNTTIQEDSTAKVEDSTTKVEDSTTKEQGITTKKQNSKTMKKEDQKTNHEKQKLIYGTSCGTFIDRWGPDKSFKTLKEFGFGAIDYGIGNYWWPDWDIEGIFFEDDDVFFGKMDEVGNAAAKHGIKIHQMHATFGDVAPNPSENKPYMHVLKRTFEAAKLLGCPYVIVHPVYYHYPDDVPLDEEWAMNRKFFTALIPWLQENDVICCLENMFTWDENTTYASCCANPLEAVQYLERLNDIAGEKNRFAFCFDTGHALLSGTDLREAITVLGEHLQCLHIHDNDGRKDLHRMPYTGIIDWERFLDGLRIIDYQGVLSFEAFGPYPEDLWLDALQFMGKIGASFSRALAK